MGLLFFAIKTFPVVKGVKFMKNFKDVAVVTLALGTAFGLGVISCVAWEIKMFAECCAACKADKQHDE